MYQTIVYIWQRVQMEDGLELWVFCGGFSGRANEEEKKRDEYNSLQHITQLEYTNSIVFLVVHLSIAIVDKADKRVCMMRSDAFSYISLNNETKRGHQTCTY